MHKSNRSFRVVVDLSCIHTCNNMSLGVHIPLFSPATWCRFTHTPCNVAHRPINTKKLLIGLWCRLMPRTRTDTEQPVRVTVSTWHIFCVRGFAPICF